MYTSIHLCNFKYCVLYRSCIFYIWKTGNLYFCQLVLREGDWSIGKVTVVQVFCHLQLKPFSINIEAQPLLETRHRQKEDTRFHVNRMWHIPQVRH